MTCSHIDSSLLQQPLAFTQIHKEECTQCFDNQDGSEGIDVCLTCFNGGCVGERSHALIHHQLTQHPIVVNIRRTVIESTSKRPDDGTPPPQKMSKLTITEPEEPQYEYHTTLKCYSCQEEIKNENEKLKGIVNSILNSLSSNKQSEVKSWQEEIVACEHTLCLVQEAPKKLEGQDLAHCASCEFNENLWLCLTCGNLGCGRKQYDGSGGNNHAIEHFEKTGHGVNVKLGTITPEGTADIYCYACDDAKFDNDLATHLANWGISVEHQTKTEKSMTELQLEQNLKFDFSMTTEDGKQLEPKFGPGYTGLKNLGNSCYMASVLQSVFNIKEFQDRYNNQLAEHAKTCIAESANCWLCQLHKIADGLLSGRYSQPIAPKNENDSPSQDGISPAMFKQLVGKGHEEFSTMRQQDAFEFFLYLLKSVQQKEHALKQCNPTEVFDFTTEQRLECSKCNKVRYQCDQTNAVSVNVPAREVQGAEDGVYEAVNIYECLDNFVQPEVVEGYNCPQCNEKTVAYRSVKFKTFPQVLVINPRRFAFINWVPQKLNIPIEFPKEPLQLDKYMSQGQQPNEELLPEDKQSGGSNEATFNQGDIDQLMTMGFSENRCKRALLNTGHNGSEMAMAWMFEHMEDPDIDDPLPSATLGGSNEASAEQVSTLQDMGFTTAQAKKALRETNNDTERALDWLFSHPDDNGQDASSSEDASTAKPAGDDNAPFNYQVGSFVSHKGTSIHCGHYVAHVYKNNEWVLFNDSRVAVSPEPPIGEAYVYFLNRV